MNDKTNISIGKNAPAWLGNMLTDMADKGELGEKNIADNRELNNNSIISIATVLDFVSSKEINTNGIHAVVAGGFPRDMALEKEPGDIDVFISSQTMTDIAKATLEISKFCIKHNLKTEATNDYFGEGKGYIRIKATGSSIPIDFCITPYFSNGKELVENFDMALCQAWFEKLDRSFEIQTTDLFKEMNERKILGYFPSKVSDIHLEKITKKFPDYFPIALSERQIQKPGQDPDEFSDSMPF